MGFNKFQIKNNIKNLRALSALLGALKVLFLPFLLNRIPGSYLSGLKNLHGPTCPFEDPQTIILPV